VNTFEHEKERSQESTNEDAFHVRMSVNAETDHAECVFSIEVRDLFQLQMGSEQT